MQSLFSHIPFIRFFLPFVSGILINAGFGLEQESSWLLIGVYAIALVIFFIIRVKSVPYKKLLFGLLVNFFFFVLGSQVSFLVRAENNPRHYSHFLSRKPEYLLAHVSQVPQQKEKTVKAEVKVLSVKVNGQWQEAEGQLICYLQRDTAAEKISYGTLLVFKNNVNAISPPLNPHEFNYKEHLRRKNILHQCYLPQHKWIAAGSYENNFLADLSTHLKCKLINIFREYKLKDEELAVVSALLLGYDDDIDPELITAYAHTGTLHVLSVSGLHVGVIYLVLNFVFGFLDKNRRTKIMKCVIVLSFLWFYALLSGLSPSVVRAAAMFSIMLIGLTFRKKAGMYNTIFVTAFFILLSDPFLLFDTGFQLSYLAVLGIVYFHPRIYRLLEFNNYLLDKTWALTAVSLAAQIGTLPVSLYYFHQFPTYFLLSNLIIIPVSTLIMYLGILSLCLSPLACVCKYCVAALSFSIESMNGLTRFFDSWPLSFIPNINISFLQTLLLYLLLALLALAISRKSYNLSLAAISVALVTTLLSLWKDLERRGHEELCVYQVNKNTVIDIYNGSTVLCIGNNGNKTNFQVSGNRIANCITTANPVPLKKGMLLLDWNEKKIVVIAACDPENYNTKKITKADLVILSGDSPVRTSKLLTQFRPGMIVADGSNSFKWIRKWKKEVAQNTGNTWFTKEQGAKVITLKN